MTDACAVVHVEMKCWRDIFPSGPAGLDKDLPSAKVLYEQMQEKGVLVDELSLKRLAVLYSTQGESAPFPEPPVSRLVWTGWDATARSTVSCAL